MPNINLVFKIKLFDSNKDLIREYKYHGTMQMFLSHARQESKGGKYLHADEYCEDVYCAQHKFHNGMKKTGKRK